MNSRTSLRNELQQDKTDGERGDERGPISIRNQTNANILHSDHHGANSQLQISEKNNQELVARLAPEDKPAANTHHPSLLQTNQEQQQGHGQQQLLQYLQQIQQNEQILAQQQRHLQVQQQQHRMLLDHTMSIRGGATTGGDVPTLPANNNNDGLSRSSASAIAPILENDESRIGATMRSLRHPGNFSSAADFTTLVGGGGNAGGSSFPISTSSSVADSSRSGHHAATNFLPYGLNAPSNIVLNRVMNRLAGAAVPGGLVVSPAAARQEGNYDNTNSMVADLLMARRMATRKRKAPKEKGRVRRKKPKDHPSRPLSAYNLFFRDERKRILGIQDDSGKEGSTDLVTMKSSSKKCGNVRNESKEEEEVGGENVNAVNKESDAAGPAGPAGGENKDAVKESPGAAGPDCKTNSTERTTTKVGFENLAKEIGARWRKITPERHAYYKEIAMKDQQRYASEMKVREEKLIQLREEEKEKLQEARQQREKEEGEEEDDNNNKATRSERISKVHGNYNQLRDSDDDQKGLDAGMESNSITGRRRSSSSASVRSSLNAESKAKMTSASPLHDLDLIQHHASRQQMHLQTNQEPSSSDAGWSAISNTSPIPGFLPNESGSAAEAANLVHEIKLLSDLQELVATNNALPQNQLQNTLSLGNQTAQSITDQEQQDDILLQNLFLQQQQLLMDTVTRSNQQHQIVGGTVASRNQSQSGVQQLLEQSTHRDILTSQQLDATLSNRNNPLLLHHAGGLPGAATINANSGGLLSSLDSSLSRNAAQEGQQRIHQDLLLQNLMGSSQTASLRQNMMLSSGALTGVGASIASAANNHYVAGGLLSTCADTSNSATSKNVVLSGMGGLDGRDGSSINVNNKILNLNNLADQDSATRSNHTSISTDLNMFLSNSNNILAQGGGVGLSGIDNQGRDDAMGAGTEFRNRQDIVRSQLLPFGEIDNESDKD